MRFLFNSFVVGLLALTANQNVKADDFLPPNDAANDSDTQLVCRSYGWGGGYRSYGWGGGYGGYGGYSSSYYSYPSYSYSYPSYGWGGGGYISNYGGCGSSYYGGGYGSCYGGGCGSYYGGGYGNSYYGGYAGSYYPSYSYYGCSDNGKDAFVARLGTTDRLFPSSGLTPVSTEDASANPQGGVSPVSFFADVQRASMPMDTTGGVSAIVQR